MKTRYLIQRDGMDAGQKLFNSEIEVLAWFHKHTSQSMDWMCKWEGYRVVAVRI